MSRHQVVRAASVVLIRIAALGCSAAADQSQNQTARREAQARASEPNALRQSITVEFDATDDVLKKDANGQFLIRAFQVGFFDGNELVRALEVARTQAEISGTRVKLVVPVVTLPRGPSRNAEVKVRSLSSGAVGAWSAGGGSVRLAAEASGRAPRRERAQAGGSTDAGAGRRTLRMVQLERHPKLKMALEPMLGPDLDTAKVLSSFPRVQELALAIVVSRTHDVALARVCDAMRLDGTRSLTEAFQSLRPSFDVPRALDAARPEARALVSGSSRRR